MPSSIEKVAEVDSHIGCAMSGLTADARTLIDHGRVEAQVLSCDYRHPSIAASDDLTTGLLTIPPRDVGMLPANLGRLNSSPKW